MEPQRHTQATLGDLLERVLDKGVMLKLDLVVGVAGIPLIGISLQGAIAAIETMLEYGMMESWDATARADAIGSARRQQPELAHGEHILFELYGSVYQARGISRVWRPGRLILTDCRMLIIRRSPPETLFETRIRDIAGIGRQVTENAEGGPKEITHLALADGTLATLYTPQPDILAAGLRERCHDLRLTIAEIPGAQLERLDPGAMAEGQLWHSPGAAAGPEHWRSGWAVLTRAYLTWWADPDATVTGGAVMRVPLSSVCGLTLHRQGRGSEERTVLILTHQASAHLRSAGRATEVLFAGEGIGAWEAAIRRAALGDREDRYD